MIPPPEVERAVGMESYSTSAPPCAAKLRTVDDDFEVEEILKDVKLSPDPFSGAIPLYRVEKRSTDTFHLEREMSAILRSRISYAGIKDKRAVATQYLSPTTSKASSPEVVERDKFRAVRVGYLERPLARSMVAGNRFRITLRDCCPTIELSVIESMRLCRERRMPNFYGLQRFGTRDAVTHRVGKALIASDLEKAVEILLTEPRSFDDGNLTEARRLMKEGRFEEGSSLLPPGQGVERMVARRLAKKPADRLGALRALPIALRRFYTQAYQSYIFNRTLSRAMQKGIDISICEAGDNWGELTDEGLVLRKVHGVREPQVEGAVPLVQLIGFAYRNYGSRFDACVEEVLAEEGVSPREFYVKEMQEVSVEGGFRRPHLTVLGESYQLDGDVAILSFVLARGEYATVLMREVVKPSDPHSAGFS